MNDKVIPATRTPSEHRILVAVNGCNNLYSLSEIDLLDRVPLTDEECEEVSKQVKEANNRTDLPIREMFPTPKSVRLRAESEITGAIRSLMHKYENQVGERIIDLGVVAVPRAGHGLDIVSIALYDTVGD